MNIEKRVRIAGAVSGLAIGFVAGYLASSLPWYVCALVWGAASAANLWLLSDVCVEACRSDNNGALDVDAQRIAARNDEVLKLFKRFEHAFIDARSDDGTVGANNTHLTYGTVVGTDEAVMQALAKALEVDIPELAKFQVRLTERTASTL